jgi:hypothetical protein
MAKQVAQPRDATAKGVAASKFDDDPMTRQLSEGFAAAVRQAIREAHAVGLAVPGREDGVAIEVRPDGEVVPIDDHAPWSPTDWLKPTKA